MSIITKPKKISRPSLTDVTSGNSGGNAYGVDFHPNSNFIAVNGVSTNKELAVWSWNGSTTIAEVETVNLGSNSYCTSTWHPNGNYLAVSIYNATGSVQVYSWNGTDTLTQVATLNVSEAKDIAWHPNGNYLALSTYNTAAAVKIYSWNGTDTLTEVENLNTGVGSRDLKWSPSGNYLYVGSTLANKQIAVYSWNGTDTLAEVAAYNLTSDYAGKAAWSSDEAYLFVPTTPVAKTLLSFAFDGSSLTLKQTINAGQNGQQCVLWNDRYLALAAANAASPGTAAYLKLYKFNRATETLTEIDTLSYDGSGLLGIDFQSNGRYLAMGAYGITNKTVFVVKVFDHP
jgi:WD40 repeat protein